MFLRINLIYVFCMLERQARAEHEFDLKPTANISLYFLPIWGLYYEYFTFLENIILFFYKTKVFQNPTSLFFR